MRLLAWFGCSLVLGLTACGGGSGDGGGATGSNTTNFPPQGPLVYTGAATGATGTSTTPGASASSVIGASTFGARSSPLAGGPARARPPPPGAPPRPPPPL